MTIQEKPSIQSIMIRVPEPSREANSQIEEMIRVLVYLKKCGYTSSEALQYSVSSVIKSHWCPATMPPNWKDKKKYTWLQETTTKNFGKAIAKVFPIEGFAEVYEEASQLAANIAPTVSAKSFNDAQFSPEDEEYYAKIPVLDQNEIKARKAKFIESETNKALNAGV